MTGFTADGRRLNAVLHLKALTEAALGSGYPLRVPDLTSLKVPSEVRDRFATAAKVRGLTVRALLDQLSREVADTALMEQAARQMSQLHESDPDAWADYLAEGRRWEEGTVEPLDA